MENPNALPSPPDIDWDASNFDGEWEFPDIGIVVRVQEETSWYDDSTHVTGYTLIVEEVESGSWLNDDWFETGHNLGRGPDYLDALEFLQRTDHREWSPTEERQYLTRKLQLTEIELYNERKSLTQLEKMRNALQNQLAALPAVDYSFTEELKAKFT